MSLPQSTVQAARRRLEGAYGLALEGLGDEQVSAAVEAAAGGLAFDPAEPAFLARLVDHLPIDESWLFREDPLWEWLRDEAGPALLERAASAGRPVRILSIGCAGGQEPFSAALLFQGLLERTGIPASAASACVQVVGLDASPARIRAASAGTLPAWSVMRCRPDWLRGRVVPDGEVQGRFRVDAAIRALCRFDVGNLVELAERGNAALGGFDLVLCRNVLIYARAAEAERLTGHLARGLDRGAVLALSAAEAHLVEASGLSPLAHLSAGCSGHGGGVVPRPHPGRRARAVPSAARRRPTPRRAAHVPAVAPAPKPGDPVADHVRVALEHAHAGRTVEALREARAALFHDPTHLYSRMLVGRHLAELDARRGREVLRALLESASALPADAQVPCADGLSVGQLAEAVKLLLARGEAGR